MTELVILRGICGSGKSTLAKSSQFIHHNNFEADMYFVDRETNEYKFNPEKLYNAHKWCQYKTKESLLNGVPVVVSNTFTTKKEMKDYLKMAEELNLPVRVIKVVGFFDNLHSVPEETLQRMRDRWQDFEDEEVHFNLPIQ